MVSRLILAFAMLFMTAPTTNAQEANYDEAKIPKFVLPDPLTFSNGAPVETEKDWTNKRRPEILKHFKDHVYGTMPDPPPRNKRVKFITPKQTEIEISVEPDSNETIKTRLKEVKIFLGDDPDSPVANLLIFLPVEPIAACPVFLGYNFSGNHTIHPTKENSKRHLPENGTLVVRGFPLSRFRHRRGRHDSEKLKRLMRRVRTRPFFGTTNLGQRPNLHPWKSPAARVLWRTFRSPAKRRFLVFRSARDNEDFAINKIIGRRKI